VSMINNLNVNGLNRVVADKITPMVEDLLRKHASNIHSFHIVGSANAPDYNEKLSDINSVVVLHTMDLQFIEFLATLGGKYGKKKVAAPLVMTPEYIDQSLDTFPIEFLDFQLLHKTVYGHDLLKDLQITMPHLRLQCEREIKTKLIGLRQGYISSLGKKKLIASVLVRSFTGSTALFRAIIRLLGKEPPVLRAEVITTLGTATGINTDIFEQLLALKTGRINPSAQELASFFERFYGALESTGKIIDALHA
jgi:hypothetical protein